MPGFTTHYILGIKAYSELPRSPLRSIISKHRWLYQLGLQGPDIFFYNIPILRHRDYRNVGAYMHEHKAAKFFSTYLHYLSAIPSVHQRNQAIAYFCGFLCHYIGDYICHPYIYGRICYDVVNHQMRHHGLHAELENDIDALLLKQFKRKKPSQFNQASTICLNALETQSISRILSDCINEAYYPITYKNNFQVTPAMVHRSISAIRFGCRTLADPSGRKKNSIAFFESIFLTNPFASGKLVTDQAADAVKSLNLNHEIWCNPWDQSLASTASFIDLFYQSLHKCSMIFHLFNTELKKELPLSLLDFTRLLDELGNYSFHSGLPLDD